MSLISILAVSSGQFQGLLNYWVVVFLMMTGFYIVISSRNLLKSIIGLNIFQTSVFLLYITMGKIEGGTAPILLPGSGRGHTPDVHDPPTDTISHAGEAAEILYSNPLPSVLMLTAIVVGIATTATASH